MIFENFQLPETAQNDSQARETEQATDLSQNQLPEPSQNDSSTPLVVTEIDQLVDDLTQNTVTLKFPPNAFILFIDEQFKVIQQQYPLLSDNEILRELGRIWLSENDEFKEKYRVTAKQLREQFKAENPAFIPRPVSKKKKLSFSGEREIRPINVKVIIHDEKELTEEEQQQQQQQDQAQEPEQTQEQEQHEEESLIQPASGSM